MEPGDTIRMPPRFTRPPPTIASAGAETAVSVSIGEDTFLSDAKVERWTRSGAASRAGALLTTRDGRRYLLLDAVRILGRRNGESDPYGLTGRVESLREFVRQGATVSAYALRLGQAVYDIEHGLLATPYEPTAVVRLERSRTRRITSIPPPPSRGRVAEKR